MDAFVTAHVLAALAPAALEVSLRAAEQVLAERAELEKIWSQRLERAAINADRAQRCYHLAEPENRLVVRQLEKDWEQALAAQQILQEEYDRFTLTRPRTLTAAEQQAITALTSDIEGLWSAATTTATDRKEIIRAIVEQGTVTVLGTSERVTVTITWAGGRTTTGETTRPVALLQQLSYFPQIKERVRELAGQGHRAEAIARRLHAEGFLPARGRGNRISASAVKEIMRELGCLPPPARTRSAPPPGEEPGCDEWWLEDLAAELDMPAVTLYSWIYRGWVAARKESRNPHRWILHAGPTQLAELRERRTRPPGWSTRRRWTDSEPPIPAQDGDQTTSSHL